MSMCSVRSRQRSHFTREEFWGISLSLMVLLTPLPIMVTCLHSYCIISLRAPFTLSPVALFFLFTLLLCYERCQDCLGVLHSTYLLCHTVWVRIEGASSALIRATLQAQNVTYACIGTVLAKSGCWSFLKGGFVLEWPSNLSILYLEVNLLQRIKKIVYIQ